MMQYYQQLRRLLGADLENFSFPSQADVVKAFELSIGRNAWRETWNSDHAYYTSLNSARHQAEKWRVRGTRFTINEVAAALLRVGPGYLLLIHPTLGRHARKVEPDFVSTKSLSDFLSPLERFDVYSYVVPDDQREHLPRLTKRLRGWSSRPAGADWPMEWVEGTPRRAGHLIHRLCALVTVRGDAVPAR